MMIVSCSWGETRIFVEYPTLGECTGDNVRIRSNPNTNAEVIGKLNEYDKIIVLGKVEAKGGVWYEVDNPTGEGEAYVFGKYLMPAYRQKFQRSQAAKLLTDIRLTYGPTPEKMLALSDKPNKLTRKSRDDIPFVIADWGDYRAFYLDTVDERMGYLKSI
ncbi:MAG: SH3 domain-containing protein, partial [Synergistaceae bacterium]|nr:SH3 domain-containing protein [Synergistaceae bacterium]